MRIGSIRCACGYVWLGRRYLHSLAVQSGMSARDHESILSCVPYRDYMQRYDMTFTVARSNIVDVSILSEKTCCRFRPYRHNIMPLVVRFMSERDNTTLCL